MRIILVLLVMTLLSFQQTIHTGNMDRLAWLLGDWQRTENKPGRSGRESWSKVSATEYRGFAYTLEGKDTIFREWMNITRHDSVYTFGAFTSDNKESVYFKFTELTDSSFVCENPAHDFPKKISYTKKGSGFSAFVTDGKDTVDFRFRKL